MKPTYFLYVATVAVFASSSISFVQARPLVWWNPATWRFSSSASSTVAKNAIPPAGGAAALVDNVPVPVPMSRSASFSSWSEVSETTPSISRNPSSNSLKPEAAVADPSVTAAKTKSNAATQATPLANQAALDQFSEKGTEGLKEMKGFKEATSEVQQKMSQGLDDVVDGLKKEPSAFTRLMAFYKANPGAAVAQLGLVLTAGIFTTSVVGLVNAQESQKAGRELARQMLEATAKETSAS